MGKRENKKYTLFSTRIPPNGRSKAPNAQDKAMGPLRTR